ncbi:hypothetical protein, partial [Agrobacterium rubi]|uniref:hypothetical protein n=1 Tax=Agrobacterium rubi TaxID=28099 RepID=UPI00201B75DB
KNLTKTNQGLDPKDKTRKPNLQFSQERRTSSLAAPPPSSVSGLIEEHHETSHRGPTRKIRKYLTPCFNDVISPFCQKYPFDCPSSPQSQSHQIPTPLPDGWGLAVAFHINAAGSKALPLSDQKPSSNLHVFSIEGSTAI